MDNKKRRTPYCLSKLQKSPLIGINLDKRIIKNKMADLKELENKIILGDCIENLKKIPDNSIDLIFADPPI